MTKEPTYVEIDFSPFYFEQDVITKICYAVLHIHTNVAIIKSVDVLLPPHSLNDLLLLHCNTLATVEYAS